MNAVCPRLAAPSAPVRLPMHQVFDPPFLFQRKTVPCYLLTLLDTSLMMPGRAANSLTSLTRPCQPRKFSCHGQVQSIPARDRQRYEETSPKGHQICAGRSDTLFGVQQPKEDLVRSHRQKNVTLYSGVWSNHVRAALNDEVVLRRKMRKFVPK